MLKMAQLRIPEYVDLERTFKVLPDREISDDSQRIELASVSGKSLAWNELLTKPRVVILSEAGSGKTKEIRQAARRLRSEGRPAFFLRLENMSSNPEDAFDEGTLEEFQEWRRTGECAWLFLDSVDEARLHSPKDFEKAIRAVKRQLGDAGPRTHIILTSRASEWRPVSDLHLCETHIPFHQPQIQAASDSQDPNVSTAPECDVNFQFVTLEDLSRAQVMTFAKACALEDLDGFLRALDHVGGATHHSRPADLLELFELWRSQRRFGSRHELIQASIKGRLREHDLDREQVRLLDRDRAHQAAKTLAAATTLSRCQEILVPDSVRHRNGIAIEDVLPDWNGPDRTTLLSRPLFDEETYGTVRFHHRSAREYLAAEWFADLLNKGSSRRSVNALFFREQYGHPIVAPVLRPILPWLVHLDGRICRAVQEHVPEILLEGGDPASLPVETRRVALERICERIADGDCEKWPGTLDHVAGFAREDLTESVRSALARHSGCGPVLEFLLQLVWKGRLVGTWEDVAKILRSDLYRGEIGRWGWIAASAIGSKAQLQELREWYLETADEVDREILSTLIEGLPSDEDESRWLQSALARSAEKKPHSYDSLEHELTEFVERLDAVHLPALLVVFDGLMRSESGASVQEELSHRHLWLLPHACQAMVRLIQDRHAAALDVAALSVLHLYGIARKFGSAPKELKYDLRSLISEWPELSLAHFWNSVDLMRVAKQPLEPQIDWHQALFHSLFQADPILFPWMLEAIVCKKSQDDRTLALSLACHLYCEAERPTAWLEQLKEVASSSPELSALLEQCTAPPIEIQTEPGQLEKVEQWKIEREAREAETSRKRSEYCDSIKANLEVLQRSVAEDPGCPNPEVISLQQICLQSESNHSHWSTANWRALEIEFGGDVARFYRDAAINFWRHHEPQIRSEGAAPDSVTYATLVGLSGLAIESKEESGWLDTLTPKDAARACRYASFEMNGFPAWFAGVFDRFPDVVGHFLLQEIHYELDKETQDAKLHHILDRLTWAGQWSLDWLAPRILELLSTIEPKRQESLDTLLKILQESSLPSGAIAELCDRKCQISSEISAHAASWHAAWIGTSPEKGIASLKRCLGNMEDPNSQIEFMMQCISRIGGSRRRSPLIARDSFHEAKHLKELHRLAHHHIRIEEDIDRSRGGDYSLNLRDYAQDAREAFLEILTKMPGKDAYLALQDIAAETHNPHMRAWILKRAKAKAEHEGDLDVWQPEQVRDFQLNLERTPRCHKELAELAKLRLLDLKDEWENGDFSVASTLLQTIETDIRLFICSTLDQQSKSRYNVNPEVELADGKRPDLRMDGMGFNEPVPIELKLANKWTGNKLVERLENQLGGDYLRDRRSARGIFLLINQKAGKKWRIGRKHLGFEELVPALQEHWESIKGRFPNIDAIDVIGIDLTARKR